MRRLYEQIYAKKFNILYEFEKFLQVSNVTDITEEILKI